MKYLKTFESFNESFNTENNLNETEDMMVKIDAAVKTGIDKLDDKQKAEVTADISKLAEKLGLTMEDMADPKKVAKAMAEANAVKESDVEDSDEIDLNEGATWEKIKASIPKFLAWFGGSSVVGGLISVAISAEQTSTMTNYLDYIPDGMQKIAPLAAIGMVAMAIGLASVVTALKLNPDLKR